MKTHEAPPRFEDEFPEAAEVLMKLCQNKELRRAWQAMEAKLPRKERIYQHINPLKSFMTNLIHGGGSKEPYVRSGERVGRNDPCPCGSGKKYKKCCIINE